MTGTLQISAADVSAVSHALGWDQNTPVLYCDGALTGPEATISAAAAALQSGVVLDALKRSLKAKIDAEAERQRLRWITPGAGQAMTYARKVEQAKAVLAAADPQPENFPMLAAAIGIDGVNLVAVANVVLAMDAAWEQIGAAIEGVRLAGKEAVDLASTEEAARAVVVLWPEPSP